MISVENIMGRETTAAPALTRSWMLPFPWLPRKWKRLSIMMTVESTTIPKSTAPSAIMVRGGLGPDHAAEREESASGMFRAVMSAARACPREEEEITVPSTMPTSRFLEHRVRRDLDERAAVVIGDDLHAGGQEVVRPDVVDARVDPFKRGRRLAAVPHQDRALHDVRIGIMADDADARRRPQLDGGEIAHANGGARARRDHDGLDVVHVTDETDAADRVGLLAEREALAADRWRSSRAIAVIS